MEPVISGGKIVFIKRALLTKSGKSMVQKIVHQVLPPLSTQRSFMYVGKGCAREKFIFFSFPNDARHQNHVLHIHNSHLEELAPSVTNNASLH